MTGTQKQNGLNPGLVDTRGLPKVEVFLALYNNARPQGMGLENAQPIDMLPQEAERWLAGENVDGYRSPFTKNPLSFDYVNGRILKVDLKDDDGFWAGLYDRDNGEGRAAEVIGRLRETGQYDKD